MKVHQRLAKYSLTYRHSPAIISPYATKKLISIPNEKPHLRVLLHTGDLWHHLLIAVSARCSFTRFWTHGSWYFSIQRPYCLTLTTCHAYLKKCKLERTSVFDQGYGRKLTKTQKFTSEFKHQRLIPLLSVKLSQVVAAWSSLPVQRRHV